MWLEVCGGIFIWFCRPRLARKSLNKMVSRSVGTSRCMLKSTRRIYRKPTHTDQYLQWDSHHTISSKYSFVGTLHHRARTICSNNQLLQQEDHLSKALMDCNYLIWALNRVKIKKNNPAQKMRNKTNTTQQNNTPKPYITVPYNGGAERVLRRNAATMEFKYTLKDVPPSKTSWWPQRTKIL